MTVLVHLVDAVIALTLLEFVAISIWHRRTGRGVAPSDIGFNLFSGLSLMLALRFALADSGAGLIALALTVAGVLHGLDLYRRWRR